MGILGITGLMVNSWRDFNGFYRKFEVGGKLGQILSMGGPLILSAAMNGRPFAVYNVCARFEPEFRLRPWNFPFNHRSYFL